MTDATITKSDSTGERTLSDSDVLVRDAINAALAGDVTKYGELDGPSKKRVKSGLAARRNKVLMSDDATVADIRAIQAVIDAVENFSPKKAAIDPVVALANYAASLRLAADLIEFAGFGPKDVEVPVSADGTVSSLPAGTPDMGVAARLTNKSVTRSPNKYDVGAAIVSAFDDVESGTFLTIRQICEKWENEGGPTKSDKPDGRVSARLFSNSDKTVAMLAEAGIIPNADVHPKGATKA